MHALTTVRAAVVRMVANGEESLPNLTRVNSSGMKATREKIDLLVARDAAYANTFDLESAEGRKVAKVSIWLMLITDVDSPLRCTMRTVQELWQGRGEAFAQLRLGARDHNKLTRNVVELAALTLPCFPGGEA